MLTYEYFNVLWEVLPKQLGAYFLDASTQDEPNIFYIYIRKDPRDWVSYPFYSLLHKIKLLSQIEGSDF